MCFFSVPLRPNACPQPSYWHKNFRSLRCTSATCRVKVPWCRKALLQPFTLHTHLRSGLRSREAAAVAAVAAVAAAALPPAFPLPLFRPLPLPIPTPPALPFTLALPAALPLVLALAFACFFVLGLPPTPLLAATATAAPAERRRRAGAAVGCPLCCVYLGMGGGRGAMAAACSGGGGVGVGDTDSSPLLPKKADADAARLTTAAAPASDRKAASGLLQLLFDERDGTSAMDSLAVV